MKSSCSVLTKYQIESQYGFLDRGVGAGDSAETSPWGVYAFEPEFHSDLALANISTCFWASLPPLWIGSTHIELVEWLWVTGNVCESPSTASPQQWQPLEASSLASQLRSLRKVV